jgi:hypothetical protein
LRFGDPIEARLPITGHAHLVTITLENLLDKGRYGQVVIND